ncbi:hypothetical protein [Nocardia harenae]|uniref:hypothetical protein n=1 Tax=Nocardia harenae TaxID=358707 RepID=UPI0008337516|nr:hypothetical protein [Nocardia harenae]
MKLVHALWGPGELLGDAAVTGLRSAGATRIQVNLADAAVAGALLRLTTFDEPVAAVVATHVPDEAAGARVTAVLTGFAERVAGWWVEEHLPLPPPETPLGERAPGLADIAFLRRPAELPYDDWRAAWLDQHTAVAIETQATFGYVQNRVLAPATDGAPEIAAIVEELFPIEALTDPHAFYGSGGDEAELHRRTALMLRSVATFGADRELDVVPTSRYVLA